MPEPRHGLVADLIVECLEHEGVTHVFGIPGEENIHLVDALSRSSIRFVLVRHEQAASFMAETYGRLTGRAGVCAATLGPGAINLLTGVADATTNSTPVVALSAQVGMDRSYKESHQGVDLVSMFAPVTKWSALMATREAAPEMVRKAFKLAQTERPGAVYLAVPEDVEAAEAPAEHAPTPGQRPPLGRTLGSTGGAGGRHLAGGTTTYRPRRTRRGARAPGPPAVDFAERLGISVATTFHGKGVFPDDHPLALGAIGFMRHDYVNFGFDQADVIVTVGYELQEFDPVRINPTGDKRIIHIHRFPAEVDRHYDVSVGLHADISSSLEALGNAVQPGSRTTAQSEIRNLLAQELPRAPPTTGSRWPRHALWPTSAPRRA